MSNDDPERQRRIADLEATLRLPVPDTIRRQLEDELRSLISFGAGSQIGDVKIGDMSGGNLTKAGGDLAQGGVTLSDDARINGVAVGVNLGRIVYGRDPEEDESRQLARYLVRLANKLVRLPLRAIDEQLERGDGIAMPRVYVSLVQPSGKPQGVRPEADDRRRSSETVWRCG